jgi:general secretion pathway protein L
LSTLYIRLPARADIEGTLAAYALVGDGGAIASSGEGAFRSMGDAVAAASAVVLLLAAPDVTLLNLKMPPLAGARLKAALPGLVEEHVLGDPADCVLVAALADAPDGSRAVAVVQRAWLEGLVKALIAFGARKIAALPSQLCLPLLPGSASAAIDGAGITLRQGQWQGLGLALAGDPAGALQTVSALAGDVPLTLYVPAAQIGEYRALTAEAGPAITLEEEHWSHWIAGARTTSLDLVPGLGAVGQRARDWQRWRWPIRIGLAVVTVNLAGMNIEWVRMKREAQAIRESMTATFRSAFPKETVILDPAAQMRKNIALAKARAGQLNPDEFIYLAGALGEAVRGSGRQPALVSMSFGERTLTVQLKPETVDATMVQQLQASLSPRRIDLQDAGDGTWKITALGGR